MVPQSKRVNVIKLRRCPVCIQKAPFNRDSQSAAFDCAEQRILISWLENTFGLTKSALDWIRSYLDGRSTFVRWKQNSSNESPLDTGVPQGSSLGPLLFSLYVAPLSAVINSFSVSHHQYVDDTQIYIALSKADVLNKVGVL